MATRKVKRYNGSTVDGSQVEDESDRGEMTAEQKAYDDEAKGEAILKNMRDTAAAKPAIVTKEQLAKSGFTNLRDYLNDQQKLTRRDGKAPERVTVKKEEVSVEKPKLRYQSLQDRARDYEAAREESGVGMYGSTKREKVPVEDRLLKNPAIRKSEQKFMGSLKFSKGGSTASSRGDGIAQRGKTKGRMV